MIRLGGAGRKLLRRLKSVGHSRLASVRTLEEVADQLASLLEAGLPLQQALNHMAVHPLSRHQAAWIQAAAEAVNAGRSLHQGWQAVAPPLLQTLLSAGERTGRVGEALSTWTLHVKERRLALNEMLRLLAYPVILLVLISGLTVFVAQVVMPMFVGVYRQLGMQSSGATQLVVTLIARLPDLAMTAFLVMVAAVGAAALVRQTTPTVWRQVKRRLPGYGLMRLARTRTIAQILQLLLAAGIPLADALTSLADAAGPRWIQTAATTCADRVLAGRPLAEVFRGDWDPLLELLLLWAEQTGELANAFQRVERYTANRLTTRIKHFIAVVEPVLLLGMGLLVTASMYVVYVPMYDMMSAISGGQPQVASGAGVVHPTKSSP